MKFMTVTLTFLTIQTNNKFILRSFVVVLGVALRQSNLTFGKKKLDNAQKLSLKLNSIKTLLL